MSIIQKAATSLEAAARSLLLQHKYSNGYISVGDSEIGEANIVLHAAASLLRSGLHVWAESPFKTHESNQCKHLDLLVDLMPTDPNISTLLTIEAKRIAAGENDRKIEEIINDYGRIRSWRNLEPAQMPLFFGITQPVEWFFGGLLVVLPESCDKYGQSDKPLFSSWWNELSIRPQGFADAGIDQLEAILKTAVIRRAMQADHWDPPRRMAVTYALFDFGPGDGSVSTAEHEAAHIIVAWRLGIPVRGVALVPEGSLRGGTVCDWESLRGSYSTRDTCIRGFALSYAGMVYDLQQNEELSFEELYNQLPTDASAIEGVRNKLRDWERLPISDESEVESSAGRELARHLVAEEIARIRRLGDHLVTVQSMDEQEIQTWLQADLTHHS